MADDALKLENNICPICLYIYIQPVTMPCGHELCLSCFKQNVEEANFCCPMCRTRISTWARRAARTNTLVNQKRWDELQLHFPVQIQSRLEGLEEDDEEMKALNVSIKLSEPGEIRSEYEEQLRKLQSQRAEDRRKEQEASMKLILELQAEEQKKQQELDEIERRDEELAKALSQANSSPHEARTRSTLGNRSDEDSDSNSNMESFLKKAQREKSPSKSPYPYPCLSPLPSGEGKLCVDKDKLRVIEESFRRQKVKRDRNLITTQDIANMEEQFKLNRSKAVVADGIEIDCLRKATASATSSLTATMTKVVSSTTLNQDEILNQMSEDLDATLKTIDNDDDQDVIIIPSPIPTRPTATNSSADDDRSSATDKSKGDEARSSSAQSTDSISVELTHFRPIRSCPLTPPRVLPGGKVMEPQLIRTTPRNLGKTGLSSPMETNLSDIDAGSPIMKRRLSELAEERKDQVVRLSKSTSTGSSSIDDDENRNPDGAAELNPNWPGLRSASANRGEGFKDISNSPFQKRKFDFNDEDLNNSTAKKKLILSLEPDLEDNDMVLPDPIEIVKILPNSNDKGRMDEGLGSKRTRLSKARHTKSNRVRYSVAESKVSSPQSSITQWVKRGDNHDICVNTNTALDSFMTNSRDEVDGMTLTMGKRVVKKPKSREAKSHVIGTLDKFLSQSSLEDSPGSSRPHRVRKRLRHDDFIYPHSSKEDDATSEQGSECEFVKQSPSKKSRRSAAEESNSSFENIEADEVNSEYSDSPFICTSPKKKRKQSVLVTPRKKQKVGIMCEEVNMIKSPHMPNSTYKKVSRDTSKAKVKCKQSTTMHDFFSPGAAVNETKAAKELVELDGFVIDQEERDRLIAVELQRQFELEAKFHLNASRFKGTKDEYSLRKNRKLKTSL